MAHRSSPPLDLPERIVPSSVTESQFGRGFPLPFHLGESELGALQGSLDVAMGQNPKARTPSEHPNPTTKIGSNMGEFTYQPKWDMGFDDPSHVAWVRIKQRAVASMLWPPMSDAARGRRPKTACARISKSHGTEPCKARGRAVQLEFHEKTRLI